MGAWFPTEPPQPWEVVLPAGTDLVVLNDAPLELAGRIALEGTILFDDDPPARVRWVADTRKIQSALGWKPRVGWRQGVRDLARWLETER